MAEGFLRGRQTFEKIPADLRDRLFRKLQLLDDAVIDNDLRVPPGNRLKIERQA